MTERGREIVGTFTTRECMVAAFVATGMEYKEAARILGMSHQMIKNTCVAIFDKTGTDSRLRLVLFLVEQGIIKRPQVAQA